MQKHDTLYEAIDRGVAAYIKLRDELTRDFQDSMLRYLVRREVIEHLNDRFYECLDKYQDPDDIGIFDLWDCIMK